MPELKEKADSVVLYNPTDSEQQIIGAIWTKWKDAESQRMGQFRYFNDRSLGDYVQDSVDRFNGYLEPRTDPAAEWGAKVFNNVTRNKTIAIIAAITNERVRAEFFAQNMEDE